METSRRTLLAGLGGLALTGLGGDGGIAASQPAGPAYLSAGRAQDGTYHLAALNTSADSISRFVLPARGHGVAVSLDKKTAVMFARRPGTFASVLDTRHARHTITIDAPKGRHFYGHGAFSVDGRLLYATENDFDGERGVIGVYDAHDGYARIGEMPSYGIGPHDMLLDTTGDILVVANGGIATHPDAPRVKLNLDTMRPSLAFIQRRNGALLAEQRLPPDLHHLSIRHLARGANGQVAMGLQSQSTPDTTHPLVGVSAGPLSHIRLLDMPHDALIRMRGYCGSVAFDSSETVLAATSPRGGLAVFWNVVSGNYLGQVSLADCCGVAPMIERGAFVLTSGTGAVAKVETGTNGVSHQEMQAPSAGTHWDNHLSAVL
ncbi:MAG: DUF1513 domain-containing protein [Alphaproteobacteria bacterium]|nr:DUF1513 domain-containing protein [Alphaproteobacteria bacterium]